MWSRVNLGHVSNRGGDLLKLRVVSILLLLFLALQGHASDATPAIVPTAHPNDNHSPAGELRGGVLNLQLEIVATKWYPEKDDGPSLSVYAFAEKGKPPQIPGPLLRVPQGTEVRAQIHNTLLAGMFIRGLDVHDGSQHEPVLIAAGATADFNFTAQSAGTYYY